MARKTTKKNTKINKKEESASSESSNLTSEVSMGSMSATDNEQTESEASESANSESQVAEKNEVKKAKKIIDEVDVSSSDEEGVVGEEGSEDSTSSDTESGSKDDNADDELERTIFIKGLDYDITEESLRAEVEKIGPVGRVNVPMTHDGRRNKGFAYIEFKKLDDAAKLLKLNDKDFMGRKVVVDKAKPKTNYLLYTVYVKNLGFSTTRAEITEYFSKFGKIHNVSLPIDTENEGRNKGYCFIEYMNEEIARSVVNSKHIINGRSLFLNLGQKNERRNERRSNDRLYGRRDNYDDNRIYRDRGKNDRRNDYDGPRNDRFYNRND